MGADRPRGKKENEEGKPVDIACMWGKWEGGPAGLRRHDEYEGEEAKHGDLPEGMNCHGLSWVCSFPTLPTFTHHSKLPPPLTTHHSQPSLPPDPGVDGMATCDCDIPYAIAISHMRLRYPICDCDIPYAIAILRCAICDCEMRLTKCSRVLFFQLAALVTALGAGPVAPFDITYNEMH